MREPRSGSLADFFGLVSYVFAVNGGHVDIPVIQGAWRSAVRQAAQPGAPQADGSPDANEEHAPSTYARLLADDFVTEPRVLEEAPASAG